MRFGGPPVSDTFRLHPDFMRVSGIQNPCAPSQQSHLPRLLLQISLSCFSYNILKTIIYLFVCACAHVCMWVLASRHVCATKWKLEDNVSELISPFTFVWILGSNSVHQVWQKAPWPAEPPFWVSYFLSMENHCLSC